MADDPDPAAERTAIAVLAAGAGSRFGATKQLAPLEGSTVLARSLAAACAAGPAPVLCVLGAHATSILPTVPDGVEVVHHRGWDDGVASSLRAALTALEPRTEVTAVIVALGDQPLVGAEAHRRLDAAHRDHGATLAVATYGGRRANPVLLARSLWPHVHELTGDTGARQLMSRFPVTEVPCDGTGDPTDVDTPAELALVATALRQAPPGSVMPFDPRGDRTA